MTYDLKVILMYCCGYSCKRAGLDPGLSLEVVLEPQFAVLGVLGASVGGVRPLLQPFRAACLQTVVMHFSFYLFKNVSFLKTT